MENLEIVPPENDLVAWRLGRVEKALETLDRSLDKFTESLQKSLTELITDQTTLKEKVSSLERSRDRMYALLSATGAGTILLIIQQIGKVL